MERFIIDERTGLKYELVEDYYLIAGDDEPEEDQPIGVWGQRHLRHQIGIGRTPFSSAAVSP